MQHAVGGGDVEQAFEQRAQHLRLVGEQARNLAGVDLVAGDVLGGEVEQAAEVRLLVGGNVEHPREGALLDGQRHAVGLGHLGGERRHRDGEGDGAISRRALCRAIPRQPRPQTGQRIAHRAAARLDADRPCYCIPCHGIPLSAFAGDMKGPDREVAESFGKVAANAGNLARPAAPWRSVDAGRSRPIADESGGNLRADADGRAVDRRQVALLDRPRRHLHRCRCTHTRRPHPRPQAFVGQPRRLRRRGAGGHPSVPRRCPRGRRSHRNASPP